MIFINTRPANRATPLTDFLQSQGVNVLELPLLELVKCELSQQEKIHLENLTQPNIYQALIFISETAVSYFFNFIQTYQIQLNLYQPIIAVGQKTAQTFENFWQKMFEKPPNIITPSDFDLPENNESLLQLPFIQSLKNGDKILILKGKDGRTLLKNILQKKGIIVDEVDFYQRVFPPASKHLFQNFSQKFLQPQINLTIPIVLITSLTAWEHWHKLCERFDIPISHFAYMVLQARIFNHTQQLLPRNNLLQIDNLHPETIFLALQRLAFT